MEVSRHTGNQSELAGVASLTSTKMWTQLVYNKRIGSNTTGTANLLRVRYKTQVVVEGMDKQPAM